MLLTKTTNDTETDMKTDTRRNILALLLAAGLSAAAPAQQISIDRIEQMPNKPEPYVMRDWKQVALGYDSLVYDIHREGQYLPLTRITSQTENFPGRKSYLQYTFVGSVDTLKTESINTFMSIIGATLCGVDKTNSFGQNWVLMSEEFFNRKNGLRLYGNRTNSVTGNDWWYELIPNVLFYQLYDLYPDVGDFRRQFIVVADRWLECFEALGGDPEKGIPPETNYRAFNFDTMKPLLGSVPEPESAGAMGWLFYMAYSHTGHKKYLDAAKLCMERFSGFTASPTYELQYLYGTLCAARMNAELGTDYDLRKMLNWCFDVGPLRRWEHTLGWGCVVGRWNGMDVSGMMAAVSREGETTWGDYAFVMNAFQQMGILAPLVRYDDRYARAIGKYLLNAANANRLFYSKYLPVENQDCAEWSRKYDPHSYIAYEAVRQYKDGKSPFATGDAMSQGWARTNLSLYSSAPVGYLGGILEKTDVEAILKFDLTKTDFFRRAAYPTYLFYNPYDAARSVGWDLGSETCDVYDAVSNTFLAKGVKGVWRFDIPADSAVVLVKCPAGGALGREGAKLLANGIVIDYNHP